MNIKNNKTFNDNEQAIEDALLKLIEASPDKTVSVRDICDLAQINRSTFYRHYIDVFDLMKKTEQRIFKEWFAELPADIEFGVNFTSSDNITIMLRNIYKHQTFFKYYLKQSPSALKIEGFTTIWEHFFVPFFEKCGIADRKDMEYYFTFYQGGLKEAVVKWLEDGCVESPEYIAGLIDNLTPIPSNTLKTIIK